MSPLRFHCFGIQISHTESHDQSPTTLISVGVRQASESTSRTEPEGGAPEPGGLLLQLLRGALIGGEAERGREPRNLMMTIGVFSSFVDARFVRYCEIKLES